MGDIFFSKNKKNDDDAYFDNTMIVDERMGDREREAEYYRQKYYNNEYSDGAPAQSRDIPVSRQTPPAFMADNGYSEDIPSYQLPFEQTVGNPVRRAPAQQRPAQPQPRPVQPQQRPAQPQGNPYGAPQYQPQYQPQYNPAPRQTYSPPVPPAPESSKPPKKKKRRKSKLLRALVSLLLVFAIAVAGVLGGVYFLASSADYNHVELEENQYISASELNSSDKVLNILFLGVDGTDESTSLRSDSMMLISIDAEHKKIKLTSFLRDCWVEIPSKGTKAKLNAAFAYGGAQLAVDTIEYNYLVDIDHYVMVNFDMFTQIIDSLGGIEVEVTEKEADFINRTTRHTIESGESVLLNGAEALVYCRIRKLDSDYMRTFRQRKVISALINKAKDSSVTELYDTVMDIFPMVQTDMSAGDLTQLFFRAGFALVSYDDIVQTQAPIEEHMEVGYTDGGQWAEFPDLPEVQNYLYEFIYTDNIDTAEESEE